MAYVHSSPALFVSAGVNARRGTVRFIVDKDEERAEVKVQEGPAGFPFLKGETYIFKYSFKAKEGMEVAKRFTHIGQLKGSANGYMVKGDPIYSLTANHHGLQVRFSNKESIEDFHPGMEEELEWWVTVLFETSIVCLLLGMQRLRALNSFFFCEICTMLPFLVPHCIC